MQINKEKMEMFLFILLMMSVSPLTSGRRQMRLTNNGYDILVGIHPEVEEDHQIVENLKQILTQFSFRLYNGTKRRAFVRSASILIPSMVNIVLLQQ